MSATPCMVTKTSPRAMPPITMPPRLPTRLPTTSMRDLVTTVITRVADSRYHATGITDGDAISICFWWPRIFLRSSVTTFLRTCLGLVSTLAESAPIFVQNPGQGLPMRSGLERGLADGSCNFSCFASRNLLTFVMQSLLPFRCADIVHERFDTLVLQHFKVELFTGDAAVETNGSLERERKGYVSVEGLILATTHVRSECSRICCKLETFGSGLYIEGSGKDLCHIRQL